MGGEECEEGEEEGDGGFGDVEGGGHDWGSGMGMGYWLSLLGIGGGYKGEWGGGLDF